MDNKYICNNNIKQNNLSSYSLDASFLKRDPYFSSKMEKCEKINNFFWDPFVDENFDNNLNSSLLGKRNFIEFKNSDSFNLPLEFSPQQISDESFFNALLENYELYLNELLPIQECTTPDITLNDSLFVDNNPQNETDNEITNVIKSKNLQRPLGKIPETSKKLIQNYLIENEKNSIKNTAIRLIEAMYAERTLSDKEISEKKMLLSNGFRFYMLKRNIQSVRQFLKKTPFQTSSVSSTNPNEIENFIFEERIKIRNRNSKLKLSDEEKDAFYNLMLAYPLLSATKFSKILVPSEFFFQFFKKTNSHKGEKSNIQQRIRDFVYSSWCVSMPSIKKWELKFFVLEEEQKKQYLKIVFQLIQKQFPLFFCQAATSDERSDLN